MNSRKRARDEICQYKGISPQPNSRWGAQIYDRGDRIWLGTFFTQQEAALAYDRAFLKFFDNATSGLAPNNTLSSAECDLEIAFQLDFNLTQVVQMIQDHSYQRQLQCFITTHNVRTQRGGIAGNYENSSNPSYHHDDIEKLFEKELTVSDVGNLHRFVIPKSHAERNLPHRSQLSSRDDTHISFLDENNKEWVFKYTFWESSRSYVFTRGWIRFVKDKNLRGGDIVSFEKNKTTGKLYIIVIYRGSKTNNAAATATNAVTERNIIPSQQCSKSNSTQSPQATFHDSEEISTARDNIDSSSVFEGQDRNDTKNVSIRLFGVEIRPYFLFKFL